MFIKKLEEMWDSNPHLPASVDTGVLPLNLISSLEVEWNFSGMLLNPNLHNLYNWLY